MSDALDLITKIVQLVGIPVAIWLYFKKSEEERRDREYGTYDALDDKYVDYLKLCLEHPDLDVADTAQATPPKLSDEQRHRELTMFHILISILERAYLMYTDKSAAVRDAQWAGWLAYTKDWCERPNFRAALPVLEQQFDTGFVKFLHSLSSKHETSAQSKDA